MTRSRLWKIAFSAVILWASQLAVANADSEAPIAIIDFQELSTGFVPCPTPGPPGSACDPTSDLAGVGDTYSSQGYTFFYTPAPGEPFPVGFHVAGPFWPWNDGTNALFANSDNALTTLKRDDGTPATFDGSTDVLRLWLLTRIGTNTDDTKCATGHGSAVGLRLYFDGINQASQFGATIP